MPHSGKKKSYLGVLLKSNFNRAQPSWGLLRALKSKQTGGWHLRITERSGGLLYLISMNASVCTELADSMVTGGKAIETGMILSIMDMKKKLLCFFHRSIFTEIREFTTIVLWKLVMNFGVNIISWQVVPQNCNCL